MPTSWALNSTSHYKTIIEECSSLDCFDTEEYNDSMAYGPALWTFLPDTFRNTSLFHVGNGEFGIKTGALILLPMILCPLCDAAESLPPSPKMEGFSLTKLILVFVGMTFVLWLLLKGISLLINLILSRA